MVGGLMARARFRLAKPEEAEATLELTMTIDEWRSLLLKVDESRYPANIFGMRIRKLIGHASREFEETIEEGGL